MGHHFKRLGIVGSRGFFFAFGRLYSLHGAFRRSQGAG